MSPRFDRETALSLGYKSPSGRLGFVKVRTEVPNLDREPSVDTHIVFLQTSKLVRDNSLRHEAENTTPLNASSTYRDAGLLVWSKSGRIIDISGDPRDVMDIAVPSDTSSYTPDEERADTIRMVQQIAGTQIHVTGS